MPLKNQIRRIQARIQRHIVLSRSVIYLELSLRSTPSRTVHRKTTERKKKTEKTREEEVTKLQNKQRILHSHNYILLLRIKVLLALFLTTIITRNILFSYFDIKRLLYIIVIHYYSKSFI